MSTKKKSLVPLFGVAFIVAIVSTGIFYGLFVGKLNSASVATAGSGTILAASTAVPAGSVLKQEDLKSVPWTAAAPPAGLVTKLEDAVGQTLVEALAQDEVLPVSKLASKSGGGALTASRGIPNGMRAVSLMVQDSAGVVAMLKPGNRVDVQVVGSVNSQFNNEPQLRTILENVKVLTVPREPQLQSGRGTIITLLASPTEAAVLGLADSTSKIRIVLRNPIDEKKENLGAVALGNIFRQGVVPHAAPQTGAPAAPRTSVNSPAQVQLLVRVAGAGSEAVKEIESQMDGPVSLDGAVSKDALQVSALRQGAAVDGALGRMQVLSTSNLVAGQRREAGATWTLENPGKDYSLRIEFAPAVQSGGRLLVRVHPEVTVPVESGIARRQVQTEIEVADGQSFVVSGLTGPEKPPVLWQRLFPGRPIPPNLKELLVFVTPRLLRANTGGSQAMVRPKV
ncbi:MAG: Flp pilus assembly protein CpaB [Bryobacterales bacterium]|nr:Flp pilus assembly protein CpaB [Bryobacterales bacterium]